MGFSSFIGYKQSLNYRKREEYLRDFMNFNRRMISEVNFSKNSLPNIINENGYGSEFGETLREFGENLSGGKVNSKTFLKDEDLKVLDGYFSSLGRSDKDTQSEALKASADSIKKLYEEAREETKKYSKLYIKLGFLIGLAVFIILL